jgi:hypothetical protein
MLFDTPLGTNQPRTLFLAGVASSVTHCGASCRLALRVPRPLKEDEKEEGARKETKRY